MQWVKCDMDSIMIPLRDILGMGFSQKILLEDINLIGKLITPSDVITGCVDHMVSFSEYKVIFYTQSNLGHDIDGDWYLDLNQNICLDLVRLVNQGLALSVYVSNGPYGSFRVNPTDFQDNSEFDLSSELMRISGHNPHILEITYPAINFPTYRGG